MLGRIGSLVARVAEEAGSVVGLRFGTCVKALFHSLIRDPKQVASDARPTSIAIAGTKCDGDSAQRDVSSASAQVRRHFAMLAIRPVLYLQNDPAKGAWRHLSRMPTAYRDQRRHRLLLRRPTHACTLRLVWLANQARRSGTVSGQTPSPSTTVAPSVIYRRGGSSMMSRRHHPSSAGSPRVMGSTIPSL
jgi:hypothetical protein